MNIHKPKVDSTTIIIWLATFALSLAILPSCIALSAQLNTQLPALAKILGPLHSIKIFSPILLLLVWQKRAELPRLAPGFWIACWGVGALSTVASGLKCTPFPTMLAREWAVITFGTLAALSLSVLPKTNRRWVLSTWGILLVLGLAIQPISLKFTNLLSLKVFDPENGGLIPSSQLSGIFTSNSAAKILVWLPWLALFFYLSDKRNRAGRSSRLGMAVALLLIVASTASILLTTHRGPLIGMVMAWFAFGLHQLVVLKNRTSAKIALSGLAVSLALIPLVVPSQILVPRLRSTFWIKDDSIAGHYADQNRDIRLKIASFSYAIIKQSPLGNSCISPERFAEAGLEPAHAHSLFVEQIRSRGWIWGALHLFLWLLAAFGAWRLRTPAGAALFAGIIGTIVLGLSDHPWFVLNQAIFLAALLTEGIHVLLRERALQTAPLRVKTAQTV